jgi:hypothetical protein
VRSKTTKDKGLANNAHLLRAWKRWHRERLEEATAGPHAIIVTQVVEFLKTITPASANALLALLRSHMWSDVDADTKFELLHTINDAISRMRERNNMPVIDDPLPDQRANAFLLIKETLFP